MTSGTKRSRARRVLGVIGSVVGATVTFVGAAGMAALIHLDRPATRRLVAMQVNHILATTLAGDVRIEQIGALGLRGVDGVRVHVRDPEGVQVLHVDGVLVRIRSLEAVRSALFDKGPIVIDVRSAAVGNLDVNLDADAAGNLRIANAFTPKTPSPAKPDEPPGRGVRVEAPEVRLGHAWVHGTPPGAPLVDADLSDLAASAHVDPSIVRAELDRVRLVTRALPRRADPRGSIGGRFAMPASNGQGMDVEALFDGEAFGIPTTVEARLNDRHVDARLDARDPTGSLAGAVVSEVAIREPLSLHAEAHGDLPHIEGQAKLVLGSASVDVSAVVEASATTRIKGEVSAREVDVAMLADGAPQTRLGLDARADIAIDDGGIRGEASIDTLPGLIDHQTIPKVEVRGKFEGEAAQVRARINDETMPTEVAVDLAPRPGVPDGRTVTAAVQTRIPDLHRVPKIGTMFGGSAEVHASARLLLPEQSIEDSQVRVVLRKVRDHDMMLGKLEAKAKAKGTIDRPVVDAEVHASELLTGTLPLAALDARAHVERVGEAVTIREAKLEAVRPASEKITATARLVRLEGRSLRVEGVEVLGVGDPVHADVSKDAREVRGRIDAPKIDLPLVARLAGKSDELQVDRGTFGIRADGVLRGGVAKGKVHAELKDFSMRSVHGARAVVDASIDDRDVDLSLDADVREAGKLGIRSERVVIGGRVDDPRSWRQIAGKVHLTGDVDLERAAALVPPERLPVSDLRGRLTIQGRVGRDAPDAAPEVQFHAHTNGLAVASRAGAPEKVNGIEIEQPSPFRSSDFDIGVDVRNDGTSGFTNVAFRATDKRGVIVAADAKAILPYAELVANPASLQARLFDAPLSVKVVVPPRRFDQLPAIIAVKDLQGAFEADLEASGTVLDPRVHLGLRTRNARSSAMPADTSADADVAFDYDGSVADLSAKVSSSGKELADLGARAEVRTRDLVVRSGDATPLAWNASARVRLASFPLESVPQLSDRRIRGRVSGEVSLDDLHRDARVKGHIDLDHLTVDQAEYTKGVITVDTTGGKLAAKVRLDQKDGFLDANASTGLTWGAQIAPQLDAKQPIAAKVVAHSFRAAAIQPFIENVVPAFDGRIDADASASIVPGRPGAALDGHVAFRDGTVLVAALGEELRGVKAFVKLSPDGTIRVTDVFARGTQGEVHADANVKLDGARVADATANLRIPDERPLALAVQGSPIGELAGTIKIKAAQSADGENTFVGVEIPKLAVELPQVTKTGVQALDEKENIHVGVYRGHRRFTKLPLDLNDLERSAEQELAEATRIDVDVRLGRITIKRGNQLQVQLSGNPKITVEGGETKIVGQVRVERGWVDVQGKKFDVEKGTVTFNGESPPDPVVVVTAGWTAADKSRIYADFVGPVTTGKVTLRSEPPRPKNEILAIVLFGTADGANPQPPQGNQTDGTTKTAVGLGGGYVAQGLTEALDDLGGIKATARIDTTRSNNPRPEVEFQLSPKVSLGFAHVIGTPPITEPDKNLANVEYRFHRNWSLETTFGDRGTTLLDAIWQKRY